MSAHRPDYALVYPRDLAAGSGIMRIFKGLVLAAAVFLTARLASAWGVEGHEAVAEIARHHLSPAARADVIQLLGNDDLASVAVWADQARSAVFHQGPLANDPEAQAFNAKFKHNGSWHFVNLPLGSPYVDGSSFTSADDVVHAIRRCVAVLEGKSTELSRSLALRLLVHFVGDIHQPLHAGNGYYDLSNPAAPVLVFDPSQVNTANGDKGGNSLHMGRTAELHAYWDTTLVQKLDPGADFHALAAHLDGTPPPGWQTPGDYHTWAEAWASESSRAALAAYQGIVFGPATLGKNGQLERISIELPPGYAERSELVVADRLAKAGLRLAALLNRILGS